jgi:hypothetical protein
LGLVRAGGDWIAQDVAQDVGVGGDGGGQGSGQNEPGSSSNPVGANHDPPSRERAAAQVIRSEVSGGSRKVLLLWFGPHNFEWQFEDELLPFGPLRNQMKGRLLKRGGQGVPFSSCRVKTY